MPQPARGHWLAHTVQRTPRSTGRVDDQLSLKGHPVDNDPVDATPGRQHGVHVPSLQRQVRHRCCCGTECSFEGVPARPVARRDCPYPRNVEGDRLSTQRQPCLEGRLPLLLQHRADLRAKSVGVVELHHSAPRPVALRRWARIAVDGDDGVPTAG
jgi:hypothetical protein